MIVSVAVVAYNEIAYLPKLLEDICAQDYPHKQIELLLIDSNSTDGTKACMQQFASDYQDAFYRIQVLDNPGQYIQHGCNVMLQNYTGDAVCRIDAHGRIPTNFIRENVNVLKSGEAVSGGPRPNIIDEETPWKKTLLLAEQSKFGSGTAPYRTGEKKSYVNSMFHGMYLRKVYDTVGQYHPKLHYIEDNEMNYRIRKAGFRLCYCPQITSYEHIRPGFCKMLQQKFRNGLWIGKTLKINAKCFSLFHFVPAAFVLGILLTTIIAFLGFPWLLLALWSLYFFGAVLFTVLSCIQGGFQATNLALPALFLCMHLCYGFGTIIGLFQKI